MLFLVKMKSVLVFVFVTLSALKLSRISKNAETKKLGLYSNRVLCNWDYFTTSFAAVSKFGLEIENSLRQIPTKLVPLAKLSPAGKTVEGFVQAVLYFPA